MRNNTISIARTIRWLQWLALLTVNCATSVAFAEQRFVDRMFDAVDIERAIQFGVGVRENGADQPLLMDVFSPSGDTVTNRPVIVLAFPGGFVSGTRDLSIMELLATEFAQRGYVAASIDYRLIEGIPTSNVELNEAVLRAVFDMRAAVRFFREDGATDNQFGTDGQTILVGGISAGAVMAGVAGVLDDADDVDEVLRTFIDANGGNEGNSSTNTTEFSSRVSGILKISGAVGDVSWIDAGGPPTYAYHEELDPVVPCGTMAGNAFDFIGLGLVSSGACDGIPAARALGVPTELFLIEGADRHVGFSAEEFFQITNDSAAFFFNEVLQPKTLASAVLPASRSVQIGDQATVFASVINASPTDVSGCQVSPLTPVPATFSYQRTDVVNAPLGETDTPFALAPGAVQSLVLAFEPVADFDPTDIYLEFRCAEGSAAGNTLGLNTVLLSAQSVPGADVIGLTTVVDLAADIDSTALFAVGSANVGTAADITVSVDDGGADLPLELAVCLTNSATGGCDSAIGPTTSITYDAASTRSFAVFATATNTISADPAMNRIFVRFTDSEGVIRGATSTAVRTQ